MKSKKISTLKLIAVILFWSINFLLIKLALPYINPLTLTFYRFIGATIFFSILTIFVFRKPLLPDKGEKLLLAAIGILQIGIVSSLSAVGISLIPPGRASILIYTMPVWAMIIAYFIFKEKPNTAEAFGLMIALIGISIFLNPWITDWSVKSTLIGYFLLILVALSWALGACIFRNKRWSSPPATMTFWQLMSATIFSVICVSFFGEEHEVQWNFPVWTVLIFNWIIASGLCYWWWNDVLKAMKASTAGQAATLVPIVVLFLSYIFFDEPITAGLLISATLISLGIILTIKGSERANIIKAKSEIL